MDDVYYRIYYCISLTWRSSEWKYKCPIPMPHEYFMSYVCNEETINHHLKEVFQSNFSEEFTKHISRTFGMQESMENNPLLLLHFARWRESICLLHTLPGPVITGSLSECLGNCLLPPFDEDNDSTQHATMKPMGDPLLPPQLRVWNNSCRTWCCHLYAYATPSPEALDCIAKYAPLIEIGAGDL